jgi:nucleoside-diphosphate-sugar epimerase
MHILVTGGAGFIGSHLCERLLDEGNRVTAVDNFDPFYARAVKEASLRAVQASPRFQLIEEDVRDPAVTREVLTGGSVDAVVHLAAKAGVRPSIEQPASYYDVNVQGTQRLLDAAQEAGVGAFILGSSSSVYGDDAPVPFVETDRADRPISPYAASKRAAELQAYAYHHLYGMTVHALRFFTVYGPRQRPDLAIHKFARLMLSGEPLPIYGDGTTSRDYTFVSDIVDGIVRSIRRALSVETEYEVINVGHSTPIELNRLVDALAEALDVAPTRNHLPMQPGDVVRTDADVSKAQRLLGYDPETSLREGLAAFATWMKAAHPTLT